MPNPLLCSRRTLANYEQAELLQQFALVAQATGGILNPQALKIGKQRQEIIGELRWGRFAGDIYIQRGWSVLVTTRLFLPARVSGEVRLSNVYGEISGSPLTGSPRLDTNWQEAGVAEFFAANSYQPLASCKEPFTLLLHADQISLSTYCFYVSNIYLDICRYLANLAERAIAISTTHQRYHSQLQQLQLPWL